MARNVNLNSSEWCDLVFEGKNKEYGAYQMRQTSTKRHAIALGCVVFFTGLVALTPQLIKAVSSEKEKLVWVDGPTILSDLSEAEKQEEILQSMPATPPPPPLVRSIQFTPPVITDAAEVNESNQMASQETLLADGGVIAMTTVITDNTDGVVIDDILKDREITGEGGGNATDDPTEFAEVMPQFPGGAAEMMKFLSSNLRYPAIAIENQIEGRVILKFVVTKEGKIDGITVVRSLDPSCDREAIRVVKAMPRWAAGMQNGNKVAVYYNLPVLFRLSK